MRNVFFTPGRSTRIDTTRHDAATAALEDAFDAVDVDVAEGPFRFRQEITGEGRFAVARIRVQGTVRLTSDPLPFWAVGTLAAGRQDVATRIPAGTHETVRTDGTPFLYPRIGRSTITWRDVDLRQVVLRDDDVRHELDALGIVAETLRTHEEPGGAVAREHWEAVADHVRTVSASGVLLDSPIVRTATFQVLVAAFVEAFVDREATALPRDPGADVPTGVRRALRFIRGHAEDDLSVDDLAAAAGMSERGLQAAFVRHVGSTPMAALRRERLQRAHEQLMQSRDASPTTVAAVAARWRFSNPGRFASQYLRAYGRSPRETLRAD